MSTLALVLVALLAPQKSKAAPGFAGRWMTSFGPMELSDSGGKVSGKYGWANEARITGEVAGKKLTFEWRGVNGQGHGELELWPDGATLAGKYDWGTSEEEFWGGYRLERKPAEPEAGEISDGQTELGLNYHLRVPKGFAKKDKKKRWTALALFHGSNSNARDYIEGFPGNWPELAEDYILVGFDGEKLSPASANGVRQYNASYVEFSGDKVGEPWRYQQTPGLVAGALAELSKELPIERWYVGGHSQGAFLTFAVAMFYPELVAGAFPVAGNLLVQCEPSYFEDDKWDETRAAQRRVPIAIVHGQKDQVVEFSSGTWCKNSLIDGGFPMLRLFAPENAGHPWAFLPVDEALRWLDGLNASEPEALLEFARKSGQEGRPRDALAALARLEEKKPKPPLLKSANDLRAELEAAARPALERLEPLVSAGGDGAWIEDFLVFRDDYAFAPSAARLMQNFAALRERQQKKADELFWTARNENDPKKKRALQEELVTRYYASSWYRLVKGWLAKD
jgi:predicted esterase